MTILRPVLLTLLLAALCGRAAIGAESLCLPKRLFANSAQSDAGLPRFDLGLVAGMPTICARNDAQRPGLLGCWQVDPRTGGALSASAATSLPGHSQRARTDTSGCIEGYCAPPRTSPDGLLLWVASTDGMHVAILRERTLYVFDAKTKEQVGAIPLDDDQAPDNTNVSNEPIELFYVGRALYVVGADAGPFTGVWSYKDDGGRTGIITRRDDPSRPYSVFDGAVNAVDDGHIALADAGLQTMLVLSVTDGARKDLVRPVDSAPCTKDEMEKLDIGDLEVGSINGISARCKKTVARSFEPYFDLAPIRLPSGDFLAALSGKGSGRLALIDGKTLTEKRRIALARCAR